MFAAVCVLDSLGDSSGPQIYQAAAQINQDPMTTAASNFVVHLWLLMFTWLRAERAQLKRRLFSQWHHPKIHESVSDRRLLVENRTDLHQIAPCILFGSVTCATHINNIGLKLHLENNVLYFQSIPIHMTIRKLKVMQMKIFKFKYN